MFEHSSRHCSSKTKRSEYIICYAELRIGERKTWNIYSFETKQRMAVFLIDQETKKREQQQE